jgi:hypothetical protein
MADPKKDPKNQPRKDTKPEPKKDPMAQQPKAQMPPKSDPRARARPARPSASHGSIESNRTPVSRPASGHSASRTAATCTPRSRIASRPFAQASSASTS